ncbi:MAG: hypothetical protein NZ693_09500 [Thermoflexales bacterium]|nr:hypothetical protein [Thermoflexales bacterium]
MVEITIEQNNQFATLSGILAGFAFAAVVELLGTERTRLLNTLIALFGASSLLFILALFIYTLTNAVVVELKDNETPANQVIQGLSGLGVAGFFAQYFGLALLLTGISLSGWVRSRVLGLLTTILGMSALCATLAVLVQVVVAIIQATPT